jgi:hypothetical protein
VAFESRSRRNTGGSPTRENVDYSGNAYDYLTIEDGNGRNRAIQLSRRSPWAGQAKTLKVDELEEGGKKGRKRRLEGTETRSEGG